MILAFWLAKLTKKAGGICWRPKLANTEADRSDWLGRPVRLVWACAVQVELGIVIWNPFVTQFGRGTSRPINIRATTD